MTNIASTHRSCSLGSMFGSSSWQLYDLSSAENSKICELICVNLPNVRINYPTAAITFNSIAIGVGNAVTSIVVRVGFGLAGPAKYSA